MTSGDPLIFAEPLRARRTAAVAPRAGPARRPLSREEKQILGFVVCCCLLQAGLFVLGGTVLRLPLRIGSYAISLMMLLVIHRTSQMHPAGKVIQYILAILLVGFINPAGERIIARLAQITLYLSVLAPILWASRRPMQIRTFRLLLIVFWTFYTASAALGVLQVHYPGRFDGALSKNYEDEDMAGHMFKLANGETYLRPRGLTDVPGGAASGAVSSVVMGLGLMLTERIKLLRGLAIASMVPSIYCIYICEGRTNLIIVAIVTLVLWGVLLSRGNLKKATFLAVVMGTVATFGTMIAFSLGGQAVIDRFFTSFSDDPGQLVYNERGRFLEEVVTRDAFSDVIGAGQGRWGMVYSYFGHTVSPLWAEMMWQALIFDGGIPLIAAYVVLLGAILAVSWKIARKAADEDLSCWAGVIFGYNIAAIASSFVFPIFSMELGLEVFLINACLYAVSQYDAGVFPPRRVSRHGNKIRGAARSEAAPAGGGQEGRFGVSG